MHENPLVIFSTAYFPLVGGAEVAVKEITDRLPEETFVLFTAKIRRGLASRERIGTIDVRRVGIGHPSFDKMLLVFLAPFLAWHLQRNIEKPRIWAIMASYGGFAALVSTWLRPTARFLLTLQEGDPLEYIEKRVGIFHYFFKKIFRRANEIQAISRFLGEWALRMGAHVVPSIVPNGVNVERFTHPLSEEERVRVRRELGYAKDDRVLITVSRLTKKNATDDIVRALALLPEQVKLLVVGEGEDEAMLRELARELGVSARVTFLGKKGHDEVPRLLHASDVFIRPSLSEGLGNSFLEAMAAEIPVIATPVGGIPDFLTDRETGLFCQPRNPASIATAVQTLEDQELARHLTQKALQCVRENYTWETVVSQMREIFARLRKCS